MVRIGSLLLGLNMNYAQAGGSAATSFATSFVSGILNNRAVAKQMRAQRDDMVRNSTARNKATGTSVMLDNKNASESAKQINRQSLRLEGANRASAASSNLTGSSVDAISNSIESESNYSSTMTMRNAQNALKVERMGRMQDFEANRYMISQMKPKSALSIAKGAALEAVLGAGADYMKANSGKMFGDKPKVV
jgi:hypothetical protein